MNANRAGHQRVDRGAFTLTELLVVIGLLVVLLGIAVPAFRSLIAGNERTLAEGQFRAGLAVARDAAVRSETGDSAAVFVVRNGRVVIIPCIEVGVIEDDIVGTDGQTQGTELRSVFVPVETYDPTPIPKGWSVRAYASPNTTGNYDVPGGTGWYESLEDIAQQGNWVYPETDWFDRDEINSGWNRQSFYVRFEAGSGSALLADARPAIVIDPVTVDLGERFRGQAPFNDLGNGWNPLANTVEESGGQLSSRVRAMVQSANFRGYASVRGQMVRALIGDMSPDTILCRPVAELALYKETDLAGGIGARDVNRTTGTVYGDSTDQNASPTSPTVDMSLFASGDDATVRAAITEWIEGRYRRNGSGDPVESQARLFTMQRYRGLVQEVTP